MKTFKRTLIQTSQAIKTKVKGSGSDDEEYIYMQNSIDKLSKNSEHLAKYAGQLVDNFHAMTSTLRFMGKAFEEMYLTTDDTPPEEVKQLVKIAEEMDEMAVKPFQAAVSRGFIEPANEFHALFAPLKDKHAQRKKIQLEYDYFSDKVKTLSASNKGDKATELVRMKEKMQTYEEQYDESTRENKQAMRDLMDRRPDSLDPMVQTMLKELMNCTRKMADAMEKATAAVNNSAPRARSSSQGMSQKFGAMGISQVQKPLPRPSPPTKEVPPQYAGEWYFLDSDLKQQGPVSFLDLSRDYKKGMLNGETHIFGGNLAEWRKIADEGAIQRTLTSL
jgi:predicted  nucleic acid-binding Zn-ribbon protein